MTEKPDRITETTPDPANPCKSKGRHIEVHREVPEDIEASSLEELRKHLEEEVDHDLQETYELTDERLVCTFWTLENETDDVERRIGLLDRKLDEIRVPGEGR
ncbi:MAG: hypothetical protein WA990_11300 [Rubrobacteraceae bacterium]